MTPGKEEIEGILMRTTDSESEVSVFDLGLAKNNDNDEVTGEPIVTADYERRSPSCVRHVPVEWLVRKKVTDKLADELMKFGGIKSVGFINE